MAEPQKFFAKKSLPPLSPPLPPTAPPIDPPLPPSPTPPPPPPAMKSKVATTEDMEMEEEFVFPFSQSSFPDETDDISRDRGKNSGESVDQDVENRAGGANGVQFNQNSGPSNKGEKSKGSTNQLDDLLDELESEAAAEKTVVPDQTVVPRTGTRKKRPVNRDIDSSSSSSSNKKGGSAPKKNTNSKTTKNSKKIGKIPKLPKFPLPPEQLSRTDGPSSVRDRGDGANKSSSSFVLSSQDEEVEEGQWSSPSNDQPGQRGATGTRDTPLVGTSLVTNPPSSSSSTSSYQDRQHRPPGGLAAICLDIYSPKFVPDDAKRVHIVLRKMFGEPSDMPDLSYSSTAGSGQTIIHDFPAVSSEDITGIPLHRAPGSSMNINKKQYLILADFVHPPAMFQTIARKELLPFLLVSKPADAHAATRWEVTNAELARDFVNDMLGGLYMEDNNAADAYEKIGKWGLFTLVYLSTKSVEEIDGFRRFAAGWEYGGHTFDTYPKDALTAQSDISILLRGSMKAWKTELTPKVLFKRNIDSLAGKLRVASSSFFLPNEVSHKGESKAAWRKINLTGDDQFHRCLRNFPESHPFFLGADAVQIRGGLRPPEQHEHQQQQHKPSLGKRYWKPAPSEIVVQQQQQQQPTNILLFDPADSTHQYGGFQQGSSGSISNRGAFNKRGRAGSRRGKTRPPRK